MEIRLPENELAMNAVLMRIHRATAPHQLLMSQGTLMKPERSAIIPITPLDLEIRSFVCGSQNHATVPLPSALVIAEHLVANSESLIHL